MDTQIYHEELGLLLSTHSTIYEIPTLVLSQIIPQSLWGTDKEPRYYLYVCVVRLILP